MANGQWGGQKTVVSEIEVSAIVDAQCESFPRLREAWDALEWLLSRSAETMGTSNVRDESLRLYVQADDVVANVPSIWIVFKVSEQIEILNVKIVPPLPDDENS